MLLESSGDLSLKNLTENPISSRICLNIVSGFVRVGNLLLRVLFQLFLDLKWREQCSQGV